MTAHTSWNQRLIRALRREEIVKLDESYLKSEIRNLKLDSFSSLDLFDLSLRLPVQFEISDFGFEIGFVQFRNVPSRLTSQVC